MEDNRPVKKYFEKGVDYSDYIESIIIGCCTMSVFEFPRVYKTIEPKMFYNEGNRIVYETLCEMFDKGAPIDLITVVDYLIRVKGVKKIGDDNTAYYITKRQDLIGYTLHLEYYAYVLEQMWINRELKTITTSGIDTFDSQKEIVELQFRLTELLSKQQTEDWLDMPELLVRLSNHQDEMKKTGGQGVTIGIKSIDGQTGGLFPGNFCIVGARPGTGKTAFQIRMAIHIARNHGPVGIISLEMNNEEVAARISSQDTEISYSSIFRGLWRDEIERDKFYEKMSYQTSNLPIKVSDKTGVTAQDIRAKALKLKHKERNLKALFIDYLQLIDGDGTSYNREREISVISRTCKLIAKELEIPVIALCQLNREFKNRSKDGRYPQLTDLRESGSLEQDADQVMFLHSDYQMGVQTDENGNSTKGQTDLLVRKWRNGPGDIAVKLIFKGETMSFDEEGVTTAPGKGPF